MASTEQKFHSAVEIIKSLPKAGNIQPSNEMKLRFYSYFKQATEGPCELPKPGFWEVVNRAKWEAWNKLGNMSKEDAMKNYVEAFVEVLQKYSLDDVSDPTEVNKYYSMIGPYIEYAPKEVQENYMLANGKAKHPLNNNSEDHMESNHSSHYGNPSKDYMNDISDNPETYPVPVNGHNLNGNNDSDSDEFSDTLDRVNEDDPPEASLSNGKPVTDDNPLTDKGPNVVNVRGGGDHRPGSNERGSPAGGPSGNRGNRLARQPRNSDYPVNPAVNRSLIGGAGGSRRSGGDLNAELPSEVGEQLAMAVIRLQHIMEQVVVRLDSLEVLLTERRANKNSLQVSTKKSSSWSFFGISPKLAIIILAWPFIAQWLMHLIRRRQRYLQR